MIKEKSPCLKCEKRTVGCHSNCEGYKLWKEHRNAFNQTILDAKAMERPEKPYHSSQDYKEIRKRKWK